MSTLAYAALTSKRLTATPGTSMAGGSGQPGLSTVVDAMAALVPAEVLVAHGLLVSYSTTKISSSNGTVITNVRGLEASFYALAGIAALLYLSARYMSKKKLDGLDIARALVPSAAFVLWTMLQRTTAFDAAANGLSDSWRSIVAILAAVIVGGVAALLGVKADQSAG